MKSETGSGAESPAAVATEHEASGSAPSRDQVLASLRARLARVESRGGEAEAERMISCGSPALDRMLPGGGLNPGTVNEWIAENEGCGAGWLSLLAAQGAIQRSEGHGRMVVIDGGAAIGGSGWFYPPAAIAAGIPAERMIVVRPAERGDFVWAADQALRNPAVAVVWGFLDALDDRDARRLQLAAETGNSSAMFVRPHRALREPSWAEVRWHVRGIAASARDQPPEEGSDSRRFQEGGDRRLQARLVRCRGGRPGGSVVLHIDSTGRLHHENSANSSQTAAVPLVAQLAHPAIGYRDRRRRA